MEQTSINRLNQLHPRIREGALAAYQEAVRITPVGVHPFIVQTMRSFSEQDELYKQGRTKQGDIVTNAKAGQTYHNYGLALDFAIQVNGELVWTVDKNWMLVVDTFKKFGFEWGGDWKGGFKDFPHLEKRLGKNWRELLALHNAGKVDKDGYVII